MSRSHGQSVAETFRAPDAGHDWHWLNRVVFKSSRLELETKTARHAQLWQAVARLCAVVQEKLAI